MKILYITKARLSFSRAHAVNIIKTAEYLNNENGVRTEVVSSAKESNSTENIFESKNVTHKFNLDVSNNSRSLFRIVNRKRNNFDVLYFRDPFLFHIAFFARYFLGKIVIFEIHGSYEWKYSYIFWKIAAFISSGMVLITERMKSVYDYNKPNAVVHACSSNIDLFQTENRSKEEIRRELSLPNDKKILLYSGSTLWYDIESLLEVIRLLGEGNVLVYVGLKEDEKKIMEINAEKKGILKYVICVNRIKPKEVYKYLLSADILLNPPTLTYPSSISSKLYEYLASGVPIVSHIAGANDEVLVNNENAVVLKSIKPRDYVESIELLFADNGLYNKLSRNAKKDALKYTWEKRGHMIYSFISSLLR